MLPQKKRKIYKFNYIYGCSLEYVSSMLLMYMFSLGQCQIHLSSLFNIAVITLCEILLFVNGKGLPRSSNKWKCIIFIYKMKISIHLLRKQFFFILSKKHLSLWLAAMSYKRIIKYLWLGISLSNVIYNFKRIFKGPSYIIIMRL